MTELAQKECVPCAGGVPPLEAGRVAELLEQVDGWDAPNLHHLTRTFDFPDFAEALAFVNRIGELAEQQNHHPDIYLTWGQVQVDIWTHKIDGLTESDFVFAAKADSLL